MNFENLGLRGRDLCALSHRRTTSGAVPQPRSGLSSSSVEPGLRRRPSGHSRGGQSIEHDKPGPALQPSHKLKRTRVHCDSVVSLNEVDHGRDGLAHIRFEAQVPRVLGDLVRRVLPEVLLLFLLGLGWGDLRRFFVLTLWLLVILLDAGGQPHERHHVRAQQVVDCLVRALYSLFHGDVQVVRVPVAVPPHDNAEPNLTRVLVAAVSAHVAPVQGRWEVLLKHEGAAEKVFELSCRFVLLGLFLGLDFDLLHIPPGWTDCIALVPASRFAALCRSARLVPGFSLLPVVLGDCGLFLDAVLGRLVRDFLRRCRGAFLALTVRPLRLGDRPVRPLSLLLVLLPDDVQDVASSQKHAPLVREVGNSDVQVRVDSRVLEHVGAELRHSFLQGRTLDALARYVAPLRRAVPGEELLLRVH